MMNYEEVGLWLKVNIALWSNPTIAAGAKEFAIIMKILIILKD